MAKSLSIDVIVEQNKKLIERHTSFSKSSHKRREYHDAHWHRGFAEALRRQNEILLDL